MDEVENDLRLICFDFIRLEEKGDFDFRMLASTSSSNFLADENTWHSFVDSYYSSDIKEEESTDDVLEKASSDEEAKRLLNQRDKKWKDEVREHLMDSFHDSKNKLENKKEKNKPAALLKRAINALAEIDLDAVNAAKDKEDLALKASEIRSLIQGIELSLNSK